MENIGRRLGHWEEQVTRSRDGSASARCWTAKVPTIGALTTNKAILGAPFYQKHIPPNPILIIQAPILSVEVNSDLDSLQSSRLQLDSGPYAT